MKNFDANRIMQRMMQSSFQQADNIVWSLSGDGSGTGISDSEKTTKSIVFKPDGSFFIKEQLFELFGMPIPAFAQQVALSQIKRGDIILLPSGDSAWVLNTETATIKVVRTDGNVTEFAPTRIEGGFGSSNGEPSFMIVRSLFDTAGGAEGVSSFKDSIMPMLVMSQMTGKTTDISKMIPFLLMGGSFGGGSGGMGGMGGMMQMMLMSQMMGGDVKLPF